MAKVGFMSLEGSEIYQLRFWLNKISPLIWRRFLVKSKSSIADLHHLIQISIGWDNTEVRPDPGKNCSNLSVFKIILDF